jgi:hypothetical protein
MSEPPDISDLVYRDILAYFNGDEKKARLIMDFIEETAKEFER